MSYLDPYDLRFKICVLGDSSVGKSSSLKKLNDNNIDLNHDMTLGVDFCSKLLKIYSETGVEKMIKLHIWDTAGQEIFRSITRSYYNGCAGFILMFDLTDHSTFQSLNMWLDEIKTQCGFENTEILLVGNKSDLHKLRRVSQEEIDIFCEKNNLEYMEMSLKSQLQNEAKLIYTRIAKKILEKIIIKNEEDWPPGINTFDNLTFNISSTEDSYSCCIIS